MRKLAKKWISIEKRLPPHGELVLGYSSTGKYHIGYIRNDKTYSYINFLTMASDLNSTIKFWQPLPEPPR